MFTLIRRAALALLLMVPFVMAGCEQPPEPILLNEAAVVDSGPGVFTLAWTAPAEVTSIAVYAGTDPDNVGRTREVGKGGAAGHLVVQLPADQRWFFEFVPETGSPLVMAARRLNLASLPNLRDAGGYRTEDGRWVKMGRLYRSDQLSAVSDENYERLKNLGLNLICDLRTDGEREKNANRVPPNTQTLIANVNGASTAPDIPALLETMSGEDILKDANRKYVSTESARAAYKAIFERLADPTSLPSLIHCTSGKDRTGWGTAALLTLLGVPRDMVMYDYMMSNRSLNTKNRETLAAAPPELAEALAPLLEVREEYLEAAFDEVQTTYGSMDGYFKDGLGLSNETIAALKENLLTP